MEFADKVEELARRSRHAAEHALTEEATRTSVVLPFLQAMGFDVFNLEEVIPEYVADVGIKKGEKIDFALKVDKKIAALVEVKPITLALGAAQYSQLYRYFAVSEARLALLTNGREVWFFSDLDARNRMDKRPFFTFDLQQYDKAQVADLARFQKGNFAIDSILEAASNLNRVKAAAQWLKGQLEQPDDEFVKLVGKSFYEGSFTRTVIEELRPAVQGALDSLIRDRIQDRLGVAFGEDAPRSGAPAEPPSEPEPEPEAEGGGIDTTEDEKLAFRIIQAIAAKLVSPERVTMRDARSYCAIILDNNNRKPVCRLHFGARSRSAGFFDAEKVETRVALERLEDLYRHEDRVLAAVSAWQ